jgi:hypothetical protein
MDPKSKKVLHWPRLDTVLMVENVIKDAGIFTTRKNLQQTLKKKIMSQTLNVILEYLEESGKIEIKKRRIIWLPKTEEQKRLEQKLTKLKTQETEPQKTERKELEKELAKLKKEFVE